MKNKKSYIILGLLGVSLISSGIMIALPKNNAHAQTTSPSIPLCEIARNLTIGSQGEDVQCLQRYLNWTGFMVSQYGSGSPGNESTYFGPLTQNAVARWQNANSAHVLSPLRIQLGTGYWGQSSFNWYVHLVRVSFGLESL